MYNREKLTPSPIVWRRKVCNAPLVFTDNVEYGFYTYNKFPLGRNQPSLRWKTFHYVAGFVIYGTNESLGIGIIQGDVALYSLADVSYEEVFDLSDVDEAEVRVTNANINMANTDIVVTMVCNYGGNIIEASYSIDIKSIPLSASIIMSHPGDKDTEPDEIWDATGFTGVSGFSKISNTVLDTSRTDLNRDILVKHIEALNAKGCSIDLEEKYYDIHLFTVGAVVYIATVSDTHIQIFNNSSLELELEIEGENGLEERDNFMTTLIKSVPLCHESFSEQFYSIKVPNGVYRRFRELGSLVIQSYNKETSTIDNYSVSINKDENDIISFGIEQDISSKVELKYSEYSFFSKKIIINTEELLFRFMDINVGEDDLNTEEAERITGLISLAPYIEY